MSVPESPPQSLIFDLSLVDEDDPVDLEMSQAYRQLMESIQGMSELEIQNQLQASASISMQKHNEIMNGLLYGILTSNSNPNGTSTSNNTSGSGQNSPSPTDFFRNMNFVARDGLAYAVRQQTRYFCSLIHFHRIRPQAREQLVWLVGQLTEINAPGVDTLYMSLLRQIRGGDVSPPNMQHAESMLRLLQSHLQPWVYSIPALIAYACFTYLRIMLDHSRFPALRQKEAAFCAKLLREKFRECSEVGRDLVRALQDVARIKEIEEIWIDLLYNPTKLNPQLTSIQQLMATSSREMYLTGRLTVEMENKLVHIMRSVNQGHHYRNMQWFVDRYLSAPESDALYCDIIRYICRVHHPANAILASNIVQRWAVIQHLLQGIKSHITSANVKLALFYDWLFYDPSRETIMNIEPAILLMEKTLGTHPWITAILIEFLYFTAENYHPPLREQIYKHIGMAAQDIIDKGVIRSLKHMYKARCLDDYPPVRDYMSSLFPAQLGDVAENAAGTGVAGGTSMENIESHNLAQPSGESDNSEGLDDFDGNSSRSERSSTGALGHDDDEESKDRSDFKGGDQSPLNRSREASREPMEDVRLTSQDEDKDNEEDEVLESSRSNSVTLSDWTSKDDPLSGTGSNDYNDATSETSAPIPGASLWIFGASLQEFKAAYETDPEGPETLKMFQHIWDTYGDSGAAVESSDIAHEIGSEICSIARKARIPESYVSPTQNTDHEENLGMMEVLIACLWRAAERDGKEGSLRVAQIFLKSEASEEPTSRILGVWYLVGLIRGQRKGTSENTIPLVQLMQLYGSYIRMSVKQDQMNSVDEDGTELAGDALLLAQEYLLRDLRSLHDQQLDVFDSVLPLVLQGLPELVSRTAEFLKLILFMATPAQIYRLSLGLVRRDFWLLSTPAPVQNLALPIKEEDDDKKKAKNSRNSRKKNESQEKPDDMNTNKPPFENDWEPKVTFQTLEVLGQTLDWETYDQIGVWQLVVSELGGVSDAVVALLGAGWIPDMSTDSKAEALSGVLNLIRSLSLAPPDVKLGRAVVRIASRTESISDEMKQLCETAIAQWARGYPDHLAAILLSLSDKTAEPVDSSGTIPASDGDVDMEDVTSKRGAAKNTRAKNGIPPAKTKLTPKQRKEQAAQLRAALSLLYTWWKAENLSSESASPVAKQLFSRIWSQSVKTQVQEALSESFGSNAKSLWPKEWWVSEESENRNRRKSGRRDTRSDDDSESGSGENDDDDGAEDRKDDRSQSEDQSGDDEKHHKRIDAGHDDESDQEMSSDNEKRNKDKKLFAGVTGSAGSSRRNSPKVSPGASLNSNSTPKKGAAAGPPASLSTRLRNKNSPVPTTPRKPITKKTVRTRKRKISDEDEDEEENEPEQDEEEEEEEEEENEEDEADEDADDKKDDEAENDEQEEQEDAKGKAKKGRAARQPARKAAKAAAPKTRASSRNKATPITRNGRRKQGKEKEKDDEESSDEQEEDEDENGNEDENNEAKDQVEEDDQGKDDDGDEEEEKGGGKEDDEDEEQDEEADEEEDDEEEIEKGKLPLYSQRKAAASANSKLMTKSSPPSSSSASSSPGVKAKSAARRRRRRIVSDDDSDE
ncbi:MAG: protein-domain-containing protein [Benniella sp.]|nr:MAG: protein-domain-containing protein [Benniella sp.]